MAGSSFGKNFTIQTWGESHGKAIGVVIDGCPAGVSLSEEDIQAVLDRRKPGQSKYTTSRSEADAVQILSGIFEDKTTGTPISLLVPNTSQISKDYTNIANCYRPGHADFTYDQKYGFRDYRGGGRSSARETIGRVAAGAIAKKILSELGITLTAYTKSIGSISIDYQNFDLSLLEGSITGMPDKNASLLASAYLEECLANKDSAGGIVECIVDGCPVGLGEPVFDKLDALLAKALMSIGAVKAVEIGDGIQVTTSNGSKNNDDFVATDGFVTKATNHSGGILGGLSDGSQIIMRAHFKPTPSIFTTQKTINKEHENIEINIKGRHDPIVVPRAIVVVECMAALTILDLLMENTKSKMDYLKLIYSEKK